jgi:uncharacterized DUF497 family protein
MEYEWDPAKAKANLRDHKVDFADAALALEDLLARTVHDPDASGEERYISLGADPTGRLLVSVFTRRKRRIRIISSRRASRAERRHYEEY